MDVLQDRAVDLLRKYVYCHPIHRYKLCTYVSIQFFRSTSLHKTFLNNDCLDVVYLVDVDI